MEIGRRIAEIRNEKRLKQTELSELSGVNYSTLVKIETGHIKKPSVVIVSKLAKALNVSLDQIYEERKEAKSVTGEIIAKRGELSFENMSSDDFENMVAQILMNDPDYSSVEIIAGSGDKGADIIAKYKTEKQITVIQCKKHKNLSTSTVTDDIEKIVKFFYLDQSNVYGTPARIIFCTPAKVTAALREKIKVYAARKQAGEVVLWGRRELQELCYKNSAIISNFFSGSHENILKRFDDADKESRQSKGDIDENFAKLRAKMDQVVATITKPLSDADIELRKSKTFIEEKEFDEAIHVLRALVKILDGKGNALDGKENAERLAKAYNNLGVCYNQSGKTSDFQKAIHYFNQSLIYKEDFDMPKKNLVIAYLNQGEQDSAKKANVIAKELVSSDRTNTDYLVYYLYSLLALEDQKQIADFLQQHENFQEEADKDAFLAIAVCSAYLVSGDYEKAIPIARKSLQKFPTSSQLTAILANSLSLKAEREDMETWNYMIIPKYTKSDNLEEACCLYENAINLAEIEGQSESFLTTLRMRHVIVAGHLGTILRKQRNRINMDFLSKEDRKQLDLFDFAIEFTNRNFDGAYQKLIDSEGFNTASYKERINLAERFFWNGSPENALKLLSILKDQAIKENDSMYWFMSSMIHALLGNKNEAISLSEQIKKLFKDDEKIYKNALSHYAKLITRYKDNDENDRMMKQIIELQQKSPDKEIVREVKDVKEIIKQVDNLRDYYTHIKDVFIKHPVPTYFLEKYFSRTYPEILNTGINNNDMDFVIPFNNMADFTLAVGKLDQFDEVTLDYSALLNFVKMGHLGVLENLKKTIFVHKHLFFKVQADLLENEDEIVRRLWNFLRSNNPNIKIIDTVIESDLLSEDQFQEVFDNWLVQTIRYARKRGLLFICDDLRLAGFCTNNGIATVNSMHILDKVFRDGLIDEKQYALAKGELAERLYFFISFSEKDLFYILLDDLNKIDRNNIPFLKFEFFNKSKFNASVRFFHLLNQMTFAGADIKSFMLVILKFYRLILGSSVLNEEKIGLLAFLTDKIIRWMPKMESNATFLKEDVLALIGLLWKEALDKLPELKENLIALGMDYQQESDDFKHVWAAVMRWG